MVPISEALNLMFSFGSFIVLLLGLMIAIIKMNQKNKPSLSTIDLLEMIYLIIKFWSPSLKRAHGATCWSTLSFFQLDYNIIW
ncbi:putative holin-like toxin [Mammaliicoccus sciuri]|uniref:putative holin-like toxin n=1 Tax=Mammaliicoccus sciuri TaxID=1296 RepID=UPI0039EE917B|nr:putative holin-like toxin [Mammaliicoccus sciuri]